MKRIEREIPGFELSEGGSMTRTPIQYQERPYLLHSNVILFQRLAIHTRGCRQVEDGNG